MSTLFRRRALAGLGLALAGMLTLSGCVTTTDGGSGASWPPIQAEVRIGIGGSKTTELGGSIAPGKCIRITYTGADGAVLQSVTVGVPGSAQVPSGAVRQMLEIVDCPDATGPGPIGPGPALALRVPPGGGWAEVFSYPIAANELFFGGPVCHARVLCGPGQDPHELLRPVLAAGPGAPLPPNVDVRFFAEAVVGATGATLRFAARDSITSLRFDWNGVAGFADSTAGVNAIPVSLPNGWNAIETYVDRFDLTDVAREWNRGKVTMRTLTGPKPEVYALGFQNI